MKRTGNNQAAVKGAVNNMKCVILAAGYATRLYPLTENFPKPLLPVGGKPILDWLIDDIHTSGMMDEFIVVTNHKFTKRFEAWAQSRIGSEADAKDAAVGRQSKLTILDDGTETNETRLGAVKDIALAVEKRNIVDDVLVMAGDNVLTFSLVPFITYAQGTGTSCVMCHGEHRLAALQRTAVITTDENDLITSYEEKPLAPKGNLAVPPFYYYKAADIKRIPEALDGGCNVDAPGSFAAWLSSRVLMHAWRMPGERYDIGDMKSYEAVRDGYRGLE